MPTQGSFSAYYIVQWGARMAFGQDPACRDLSLSKHFWTQQQHKHVDKTVLEIETGFCHKCSQDLLCPLCCSEEFDHSLCTAFTKCLSQHIQEFWATSRVSSAFLLCFECRHSSNISSLIFLKCFVSAFHSDWTCSVFHIFRCHSGTRDVFSLMREWGVFTPLALYSSSASPYSVSFMISHWYQGWGNTVH